ncbi:hypothetical protein [Kribbella catacumbae]|uniref:hypothetical protein n=1 Tax=Kribbella catacumbae TaxID=460086 RepID=UPI00036309C7|nr:hypothetical protein [Kribbella catacumbae]
MELVPTPELTALRAVGDWIAKNPNPNAGGAKIADDRKSVTVSWKGIAPPGLQALAASQPVPVTFRVAAYSSDELAAVAKSLVTDNPGVVTSAGESPDYSGVVVWLSSKAPPTALANLKARSTVQIVSSWTEDPGSLGGAAEQAPKTFNMPLGATVDPHRAGDRAPWFGGGLIRARGVSGSRCSNGVALTAGDEHFYMSMASHCGLGTWVAYDTGTVMGYVKPEHWNHNLDFQIVETSNAARIWTGPWNTTASRTVKGIVFLQTDDEVVMSGGGACPELCGTWVTIHGEL